MIWGRRAYSGGKGLRYNPRVRQTNSAGAGLSHGRCERQNGMLDQEDAGCTRRPWLPL